MNSCTRVEGILTDSCLFPLVQSGLLLFVVVIFVLDVLRRSRARGGFSAIVTRGEKSMAKFYGAYGVLTTIFVTLCVSVESAKDHRTLFILIDVLLIAYACLLNGWFRNKLIAWTTELPKREHR